MGIDTEYLLPLKLLAQFPKDWDSFARHDWIFGGIDRAEDNFFQLQKDIALFDRFMDEVIDEQGKDGYKILKDISLIKKKKNNTNKPMDRNRPEKNDKFEYQTPTRENGEWSDYSTANRHGQWRSSSSDSIFDDNSNQFNHY